MSNLSEAKKLKRPVFQTRKIRLVGPQQKALAKAMIDNAPEDADKPLLLTLGEEPRGRTLDQNAAMWAGPLRDIEQQGWLNGRQYRDIVWHEQFKQEYLPDETLLPPDELALRVKNPDTYRKWDITPKGERICVGSTTELTKFGFGEYLAQVEAFGAQELGVQFSATPGGGF